MTSPYILKGTSVSKPASGRSFVYIMSLNINDEYVSKPLFIGTTKNIAKMLSNNAKTNWHYNHFARPIIVTVVGSIPDGTEETALKTLKKTLVDSGCLIPSGSVSPRRATEYSKNKQPIFYDLTQWLKENKGTSLKVETREHKTLSEVKTLTRESIKKYINYQDNLDTESLNLALKILDTFNSEEGKASIVFEKLETYGGKENLQKMLNKIKHIWNPTAKFKPFTVNEYRLTKPAIAGSKIFNK